MLNNKWVSINQTWGNTCTTKCSWLKRSLFFMTFQLIRAKPNTNHLKEQHGLTNKSPTLWQCLKHFLIQSGFTHPSDNHFVFLKAGSLWPRWFYPLKIQLLQSEDWCLSVLAHHDALQLIYSLLSNFNSGNFLSFSLTLLSFSHS